MAKQSVMSVATVATLILLLHLQLRLAGEKSIFRGLFLFQTRPAYRELPIAGNLLRLTTRRIRPYGMIRRGVSLRLSVS